MDLFRAERAKSRLSPEAMAGIGLGTAVGLAQAGASVAGDAGAEHGQVLESAAQCPFQKEGASTNAGRYG